MKKLIPTWAKRRIKVTLGRQSPSIPVGRISFGDLRRTEPISRQYGFDRGRPIDRYYIETFLKAQSHDIRGRVLEIADNNYTQAFGGSRVSRSDILHVEEGNSKATYVGNLEYAPNLPSNTFDCAIVTQTLHLIFDVKAALTTLRRILKPGGVVLVTVPGISQISDPKWNDTWYWAFTTHSVRRLAKEVFSGEPVEVAAHGNVLSTIAFLHGIADCELDLKELDIIDQEYQLLLTLRAEKAVMA